MSFCDYHIKTAENPDGTDCSAHMTELRIFKCPYYWTNLKYDKSENKIYIAIENPQGTDGICQDFKPSKELSFLVQLYGTKFRLK